MTAAPSSIEAPETAQLDSQGLWVTKLLDFEHALESMLALRASTRLNLAKVFLLTDANARIPAFFNTVAALSNQIEISENDMQITEEVKVRSAGLQRNELTKNFNRALQGIVMVVENKPSGELPAMSERMQQTIEASMQRVRNLLITFVFMVGEDAKIIRHSTGNSPERIQEETVKYFSAIADRDGMSSFSIPSPRIIEQEDAPHELTPAYLRDHAMSASVRHYQADELKKGDPLFDETVYVIPPSWYGYQAYAKKATEAKRRGTLQIQHKLVLVAHIESNEADGHESLQYYWIPNTWLQFQPYEPPIDDDLDDDFDF